jgi:DNA-binding transcriptional ArsR family regulator
MPIEFDSYEPSEGDQRLEFREGSNAYAVVQFLAAHPEQGFTPKEISEETGIPRNSVGVTLSRLEDRGLVRHKEPYWAIGEDDRLAAYAGMRHGLQAATDRFGDEDWGDWEATAVDPRVSDDDE